LAGIGETLCIVDSSDSFLSFNDREDNVG